MIRRIRSFGIVGVWAVLVVVAVVTSVAIGRMAKEIENLREAGVLPPPSTWWANASYLWSMAVDWLDALPWHHPVTITMVAIPIMVLIGSSIATRRNRRSVANENGNVVVGAFCAMFMISVLGLAGWALLSLHRAVAPAPRMSAQAMAGDSLAEPTVPDEVYIRKCLKNTELLFSKKCDFANHELEDRVEVARSHHRRSGRHR